MRPYWSRAETDRYGSTPVAASPARNRPPGPNFHITKSRRRAAWGLPPGSPRGPKRCSRCSWPLRRHAQAPDQFAQVVRKLLLDQFRVHGPQLPADFRLHVAADPRVLFVSRSRSHRRAQLPGRLSRSALGDPDRPCRVSRGCRRSRARVGRRSAGVCGHGARRDRRACRQKRPPKPVLSVTSHCDLPAAMTHRVRVEAKDIGVDQRPIIPIVPRRCLVDRPASRAAAEAISGTVEACFELMLASARQSSDGRREAVIWITSARNGEPHDLRKLPSPTRRFRIDYCAYSLSPAGSPVAAAILCVAGVRHLARLSDPAGFSGILAKIAGWRAAFRSGGALGVEPAGGDPLGRQHARIALIAVRLWPSRKQASRYWRKPRMNAVRQPEAPASRRPGDAPIEDAKRRGREWALERGLEETFPASDPVAILQPSVATGRGER